MLMMVAGFGSFICSRSHIVDDGREMLLVDSDILLLSCMAKPQHREATNKTFATAHHCYVVA